MMELPMVATKEPMMAPCLVCHWVVMTGRHSADPMESEKAAKRVPNLEQHSGYHWAGVTGGYSAY
jgi:hypothetical protein